jgi:A/G-specific adenine glycosylase
MTAAPAIAGAVVRWQKSHGRHDLPWQRTRDPYRVWLSEVMLQQTQVTTVLGYYARFLDRYPDVAALAAAPLDDVLALWSGLGYYSRARHLHRCAQAVVHEHGGAFPRSAQALAALPGIGRSTAAAIAAFCFGERVAILDGNVKRVLTRVLAFDGDLAESRHERALWDAAAALLPARSADMPGYTQGLMDLGATVCAARDPKCLICPLASSCAGARSGRPADYPVKSRKLKRGQREHWWLCLHWRGQVWLQQRPARGVWAGLWTLPLFDSAQALSHAASGLKAPLAEEPVVQHALTHFDWTLRPHRAALARQPAAAALAAIEAHALPAQAGRWVALDALDAVALPAPLRKWLLRLSAAR